MFIKPDENERERAIFIEQIIQILKEVDAGLPVKDLCREHSISDATFYTWRKKLCGTVVSVAKRLEAVDRRPPGSKLSAESLLDNEASFACVLSP